jgi:serine protease Do
MGIQLRELASWARNRKFLATGLLCLTLAIGILIGTVISGRVGTEHASLAGGAPLLVLTDPVSMSSAFSEIVKRDEPAVVNISTTQVIARKAQSQPPSQGRGPNNQPFQDFFNRFFDSPEQGPEAERSLGSGMIVDKTGLILTNNHVVEEATKIQVQLNDDPTLYTAQVVGTDEETDLAVIKIDVSHDLPTIKLGNSDGTKVGDWVLAIGSPFGLQATVTAGIISATDRGNVGRQFQHFLQTDAAINPGNSGGPLVNLAGEVIGINTAILTGGRGYEGVGFALPSATAVNVYNQIIQHGKVTRGSIGVSFTEDESRNPIVLHDLGAPYGMILQAVEPGSPADVAGLRAGDVVTAINGKPVKSGSDLVNPVAVTPIGQSVRVSYMRNRQVREATLTVEDRSKLFPDRAAGVAPLPDAGQKVPAAAEFGLRVEELSGELARTGGYGKSAGVVVTDVAPVSFAEDAGLLRGDVIAEINHVGVPSVNAYRQALGAIKPGQEVLFKVLRRAENDRVLTVLLAGTAPSTARQTQ